MNEYHIEAIEGDCCELILSGLSGLAEKNK